MVFYMFIILHFSITGSIFTTLFYMCFVLESGSNVIGIVACRRFIALSESNLKRTILFIQIARPGIGNSMFLFFSLFCFRKLTF